MTTSQNFTPNLEDRYRPILKQLGYKNPILVPPLEVIEGGFDIVSEDDKRVWVRTLYHDLATTEQSSQYLQEWQHHVYICYSLPSGASTEWDKLFGPEGEQVNAYLYGWDTQGDLVHWALINVPVLRWLEQNHLLKWYELGGDNGNARLVDNAGRQLIALPLAKLESDATNNPLGQRLVPLFSSGHPGIL